MSTEPMPPETLRRLMATDDKAAASAGGVGEAYAIGMEVGRLLVKHLPRDQAAQLAKDITFKLAEEAYIAPYLLDKD